MERRDYSIVHVDGILLEHVSEFKYMGCILDESDTDGTVGRWQVVGGLQVPSCPWLILGICVLLKSCMKHCLCLFLCMTMRQCYGRRRTDLGLGLSDGQPQRMDRIPIVRIRELCRVKKGLDERINEDVVWPCGEYGER